MGVWLRLNYRVKLDSGIQNTRSLHWGEIRSYPCVNGFCQFYLGGSYLGVTMVGDSVHTTYAGFFELFSFNNFAVSTTYSVSSCANM